MDEIKIPYEYRIFLKNRESEFLKNFSIRSRNALAAAEIFNQNQLQFFIESGRIFGLPRLGAKGLREVITWAWKNKIPV